MSLVELRKEQKMTLNDWIRNKLSESRFSKSELYKMYNLACDELDRVYTMDTYSRSVRRMFTELIPKIEIVNKTTKHESNVIKGLGNVLVVSDLHLPFVRNGYLEFVKEQYNKFGCKTVVFIGDIIDNHAISLILKLYLE